VRQPRGQPAHAGNPGFDVVASKLRRPQVRSRTVQRSSLIEKLTREDTQPIISVVAPAGYGKKTLLSMTGS
jgi:LuxR family maltose regulon positive regulatory protein